jgi:FtsP/CotA-like multicopper oxidase with cupredoxin domain
MMDRRSVLKGLGVLGIAGSALPQTAFAATRKLVGLPFVEPTSLSAVNGVLNFATGVMYGRHDLYGNKVHLRGFDGELTGKTLRVKAGERLHFNMVNVLPKAHGKSGKSTVEKEAGTTTVAAMHSGHAHSAAAYNVTNLHVHGLHVSPKQPSDYVLMEINPGDFYHYKYEIPADHPPGTYFYHPHYHGAVGVQVGSGMAGALIIEGDVDRIPEIAAAAEKVMVLQTLAFDAKGQLEDSSILRGSFPFTVNGRLSPVLTMRPGEVQRWRMVNASFEQSITLALNPSGSGSALPITVLCLDGNPLSKATPVSSLTLASGNRADVLVKAPATPGTYQLSYTETTKTSTQTQIVLTVKVEGPAKDMPLYSGALPSVPLLKPIAPSEVTNKRTLVYGYDKTSGLFTVDGVTFGSTQPQQNVTLGAVEEWTVTDTSGFPHSFHIHVNPFQVVTSPTQPLVEAGQWMDTLEVPANGSITFRSRFVDFDGTFVLHCHFLPHEDDGLMQVVNVNKAGK